MLSRQSAISGPWSLYGKNNSSQVTIRLCIIKKLTFTLLWYYMQPKSVGPHHIVVKSDLNLIVGKGGGAGFGQFELLPFDSKKLKITPF